VFRAVILTIFFVGLLVVSSSSPAWAAQMEVRINPNNDESTFKVSYIKTVFIEYPNGGKIFDELRAQEWTISGTADSTNPDVQNLT